MSISQEVLDLINLIASLSGIILAIVSLILSILFYSWSDITSRNIVSVSQTIDSNTKKIEQLIDKLYSDTFGIMKESHSAMLEELIKHKSPLPADSSLNQADIIREGIKDLLKSSKLSETQVIELMEGKYPDFTRKKITEGMSKLISEGSISENNGILILRNTESISEQATKR